MTRDPRGGYANSNRKAAEMPPPGNLTAEGETREEAARLLAIDLIEHGDISVSAERARHGLPPFDVTECDEAISSRARWARCVEKAGRPWLPPGGTEALPSRREPPAEFDQAVIIEWPGPASGLVAAGLTRILDAETGEQITAVKRMDLHWDPESVLWADAEVLTGADGKMLTEAGIRDLGEDGPGTAHVTFLVTEMRPGWLGESGPFSPILPVAVDGPGAPGPEPRLSRYPVGGCPAPGTPELP